MNKTLTHSMKSYITIFLVGILVGCICRLTDYCPADTLWSFSSIQTLLGFWIITNTIIVLASTSNICAGISSFLYMFGMTLSFYGLQAILGTFIPLFSGGFRTSLFILFTICWLSDCSDFSTEMPRSLQISAKFRSMSVISSDAVLLIVSRLARSSFSSLPFDHVAI